MALDSRLENYVLGAAPSPSINGCFDCNICLDHAQDPVVTLCGHLYCWPCIYKWLRLETAQHQCPVCKASLSQTTLVPLYGRGYSPSPSRGSGAKSLEIPRRPPCPRASAPVEPNHHRLHHPNYDYPRVIHPMAGMIGGMAIAVLPWVLGSNNTNFSLNYYPVRHHHLLGGGDDSPRMRRQEKSLHFISVFLFCCFVLCFLLF
ncbi:E3 ubiquitin-protein ligase RMA3 [Acorus gramineus]|uniref:E3 ubiquitin-protein ligase RMA n=1 Tax=Acorus gramineus TaxID=55184 RepID=A0AAV9A9C9_ACOGR|nr:E3 ubiquitin-protein ligase RMA3 [Acorus gramineus]